MAAADYGLRSLRRASLRPPFAAHNTAEFTFEPQGKGARVAWAMTGPHTVMSKLMGVFFGMDKMVEPQFEEGLANLKRLAETQTATA